MLNFCAHRTLSGAAPGESLVAQDCVLCGAGSRRLVCAACEEALPRALASCARCALPLPLTGICGQCVRRAPAFDAAAAAFDYRFPVDRLVRRYKYAGDLAVGRWLGERLAERVGPHETPALIVAPPSTRERLRARGFNPALEIAKVVARRVGASVALEGLVRTRETAPQPGLARNARRRNIEGAYATRLDLAGRDVVIVDDVMTTGATLEAAARVLKRAGAGRVTAWVAARTP